MHAKAQAVLEELQNILPYNSITEKQGYAVYSEIYWHKLNYYNRKILKLLEVGYVVCD